MKVTVNLGQVKAWMTFLVGLAGAAYAAYLAVSSSGSPSTFAIAAAVILGVERYVSDPSTGNTQATWANTPPAPPVAGPSVP